MKKMGSKTYVTLVRYREDLKVREALLRTLMDGSIKDIDGQINELEELKKELTEYTEEYGKTLHEIAALNVLLEDEEA